MNLRRHALQLARPVAAFAEEARRGTRAEEARGSLKTCHMGRG